MLNNRRPGIRRDPTLYWTNQFPFKDTTISMAPPYPRFFLRPLTHLLRHSCFLGAEIMDRIGLMAILYPIDQLQSEMTDIPIGLRAVMLPRIDSMLTWPKMLTTFGH